MTDDPNDTRLKMSFSRKFEKLVTQLEFIFETARDARLEMQQDAMKCYKFRPSCPGNSEKFQF